FPIIADEQGIAAKKLGIIHPGKGTNTVRAVFIVDANGVIRAILLYPQELGRNLDEVVRMVKGLQTNEKYKVAMPADWPKNELVGDHVIVPPASDVATAKKRKEQYPEGYYDWWFCHKELKES
ncbi:MAG: redoxin domain-containing protein, partial [Candidatus Coatesbacteria bacterium]|nr:redoxin domain-containing protein [Candidatus Coatesbacteria bacterium]